jgi:hypothetical protein
MKNAAEYMEIFFTSLSVLIYSVYVQAYNSSHSTYSSCLYVAVPHAATARILISMNLAGQVVFFFVADYIHWGYSTVTAGFAFSYLTVTVLQVSVLCYECTVDD